MDKYFNTYREMIPLSRSYGPYSEILQHLHPCLSRLSFRHPTEKSRGLSDRTVNHAISQLPMRKFDEYLPYVPSKEETWQFISSMSDVKQKTMVALMYSSGLRVSVSSALQGC